MSLLGREKEKQAIQDFFLGESSDGPGVAVLSGEAGIGKSLLARHFRKPILNAGGLFLEMTCDPISSSEVVFSRALETAFELVRESISTEEWRRALGPFSDVVTNRLGSIGDWLNFESPPHSEKRASQQSLRFRQTSSLLMSLLQELARPLALFVDDLHWADPETLELLRFLSEESELSELRILTAVRSDEYGEDVLKGLSNTSQLHLSLEGLPSAAVRRLVEQELTLSPSESGSEAQKLLEQCQGNPLYIQAALRLRSSGEEIDSLDREQLLIETLKVLSPQSLQILSQAAAIGKSFYPPLLSSLSGVPETELQLRLARYEEKGFLAKSGPAYEFRHDKLRDAVLELTPANVRTRTHQALGDLLTARDDFFIEGVEHYGRTINAMDGSERERFARRALQAARDARKSGAAHRAFQLCRQGAQALGAWPQDSCMSVTGAWQAHSELAGALCLEAAEASEGSTEESHWELPITLLKNHCLDPLILARATLSRARALARQNRHTLAVEACEEYLKCRPDYRPPPSNRLELVVRLFRIFRFVKRHAATQFRSVPVTDQPIRLAIHEIMRVQIHSLIHSAFHKAPSYTVRECEEFARAGLSKENVHALLSFAVIMKWKLGHQRLAERLTEHCSSFLTGSHLGGSLQLALLTREIAMESWTKTTPDLVASLEGLHQRALTGGEIEVASAALDISGVHLFFSGAPLRSVAHHLARLRKQQKRYRTATADYFIDALAWALDSLQKSHRSDVPLGNPGIHDLVGRAIGLQTYLASGQHTLALNLVQDKTVDERLPIQGHTYFYYWLYAAFAAYWGARAKRISHRGLRSLFRRARKALIPWCRRRQDRSWYQETLEGVEALAFGRLIGVTKLCRASSMALDQGAIHVAALIAQVLADYERGRGASAESARYDRQSESLYSRWKGEGKSATSTFSSDDILISAIEVLSSQKTLRELTETFLFFARKHSRADRVLLLQCESPSYQIIGSLHDEQQASLDPEKPSSFPFSILSAALIQGETMALAGSQLSSFASDPFLAAHAPRSLLVVPIAYRERIQEVLYLESSRELESAAKSLIQLLSLQWKFCSLQLEREEQLYRHQQLLDKVRQTRHQEALQSVALKARRNALATFLGVASHDLKAPLSAISLWASQLSEGPERENIEAACARATGLIHDYLDGMALELGNSIRLEKKRWDLAELVEQEIDLQLDALAPSVRGVTRLVWELESVEVEADAPRFRQVVANLLGNALKHCPQGTRVSVSTTTNNGEALLRVEDEGPGLDPSRQARLFEAFKTTASSGNGTGLGLWIVKKIVEAHDGRFGYEERQPGSSFWVRLPAVNGRARRGFAAAPDSTQDS